MAFATDMDRIGIRVKVVTNTWAEFLRKTHEGRLQVFRLGWILDYPDPENFLQLLYGPNKAPGPNASNYDNPEFNRLFDQMKAMDDTPERLEIIQRMVAMVIEDAPWIPSTHTVSYVLRHQWVSNAKAHAMRGGFLKYRDVDVALREKLRREWNRPNYRPLIVAFGVVFCAFVVLAMFKRIPPAERSQQ
jgi:ABC-type transport system substrate-binding protein